MNLRSPRVKFRSKYLLKNLSKPSVCSSCSPGEDKHCSALSARVKSLRVHPWDGFHGEGAARSRRFPQNSRALWSPISEVIQLTGE